MTSLEKGEGTLDMGGQVYRLKLGTLAMETIEETLSTPEKFVSFEEAWQTILFHRRVRYLRIFVWAMLRTYHPEIKLDQMHTLLDSGSAAEAMGLLRALGVALEAHPEDAQALAAHGAAADPRPARARKKAGTGARSTSKLAHTA